MKHVSFRIRELQSTHIRHHMSVVTAFTTLSGPALSEAGHQYANKFPTCSWQAYAEATTAEALAVAAVPCMQKSIQQATCTCLFCWAVVEWWNVVEWRLATHAMVRVLMRRTEMQLVQLRH